MLDKYGVKVIGVNVDAIKRGEDRQEFKNTMQSLGIDMPRSEIAYSVEEAEKIAERIGYPAIIRPAYTMGGTGGGAVFNIEELRTIASRGLSASLVGQILVEESVLGWEELELEVVRDAKGQKITVCFIENVDPMGVHTGDSYCTAPMLTIDPKLQEQLQKYSYDIVDAIEVIGGTNIQFAHDPDTGRVVVIEINPRTSRSSALASKATGFPIAFVSSLLAAGLTLDEIPYWRDGTLEKYTPSGDYVVVKFSRWAFEKFKGVEDKLGTQMRAVGEVMSIGKNYKEAFQKSIRSLEIGRHGLGFAKNFNKLSLEQLLGLLTYPTSERQFIMYEALRKGASIAGPVREDPHQALVHPADGGAGRPRRGDPQVQGQEAARQAADRRPRKTDSPTSISRSCSACRRTRFASAGSAWASSKPGTPCRSAAWRMRPTTTPPTTLPTRSAPATDARSSSSAAVPTASARASSSTTAASTRPSRSATKATSRS